MKRTSRLSLLVRALVVAVVGLSLLPGNTVPPTVSLDEVADMRQFRAGNIISDAIFFDGRAADDGTIQRFLEDKNPSCASGGDGTPCLKRYLQSTPNRPADAYCQGYTGAVNESAATIIMKVGRSCGVSQRALLVMLQKEQGLVTGSGSGLNATRYRSAMGFGCPDTADCDAAFYGFFNQVYNGARQFKVYAQNPARYGHKVGAWNNVRFHPNPACGTAPVYIENQATAGLYNYTPYQPNAAALAAGRGLGDSCSAYGNRNFWGYYTDWFGSTHHLGADRITEAHLAHGGSAGPLGAPTSLAACYFLRGGCGQQFAGGSIYWSPATGAHPVVGAVRDLWVSQGWENGRLGYATADMECPPGGGCLQVFEGGVVTWTASTGTRTVEGAIRDKWAATGHATGWLGYPTGQMACGLAGGGCSQPFQGGSVYWSGRTGAFGVQGAVRDHWVGAGAEGGPIGYPVSDMACATSGRSCWQSFQTAAITWGTGGAGTQTTSGAIRDYWAGAGAGDGAIGVPVQPMVCGLAGGGCKQEFQSGTTYWSSATGARAVAGAVRDAWLAAGGEGGPLRYPATELWCGFKNGGCGQQFQGGSVYFSPGTGAHAIQGAIRERWTASGWESGPLGYPTTAMECSGTGCRQSFQGGTVTWLAGSGTRLVSGAIGERWVASGRESGALGYPTTEMACGFTGGGCGQQYQGGSVYWSPTTGAHGIYGAIRAAWMARGWESGPLGYPTDEIVCGQPDGGCLQTFQGGTLTWSPLGNAVRLER
jgi:uncharacterized protein with LGFP repeats